jgi:hypothetical protein
MTMTTDEDARPCNVQHKKPCHDCPWRRKAVPGWLGANNATEWLNFAHGEAKVDCHTVKGDPQPQCVGIATYRANILKLPRDPSILRGKVDRKNVFATPGEFIDHHGGKKGE